MSRTRTVTLLTITVIITILNIVFFVYVKYTYERDIDAVLQRAQVAANRTDMLHYMERLKQNMEKHDLTHGHTALFFKTPANDLALYYRSVGNIIGRLESIENVPENDTVYQVALDDIRGIIRELPDIAFDVTFVRYWHIFIICIGSALVAFVLLADLL